MIRLTSILFALSTAAILVAPTAKTQADEKPRRVTIATWNLEWFYDHHTGDNFSDLAKKLSAPSEAEWNWRIEKVAGAIAEMNPTIIALQEVENRKVLFDLRNKLREKHKRNFRIAYIEGFDPFTEQDVAIMFQGGLVEFSLKQQSSEMYDSNEFRNLSKHIFARFEWGAGDDMESLTIANVHLKATPESFETRNKQVKLLRKWLNEERERTDHVIALGDFNSETEANSPDKDSEIFLMRGMDTRSKDDDLHDVLSLLPQKDRATHMIGKQFDRILISDSLLRDDKKRNDLTLSGVFNRRDLVIQKKADRDHRDVYFDIPQNERDLSDHYPIIAVFEFK